MAAHRYNHDGDEGDGPHDDGGTLNIVDFVKTTASVSGFRIGETPTSSAEPGQYVPRTMTGVILVFGKSARRQSSVNYTGYTPPSPGPWSWWSSLVVGGGAGVRAHAGELSGLTAACLLPPRRRFKGCWCREAAVASHSGRCRVSMEGRCNARCAPRFASQRRGKRVQGSSRAVQRPSIHCVSLRPALIG